MFKHARKIKKKMSFLEPVMNYELEYQAGNLPVGKNEQIQNMTQYSAVQM